MKKNSNIATPVILRMPRYYRCVDELYQANCVRVSSNTLAARLGLTASQIRQDFSCFGEFGQQGYGYNVKKLRSEIQEILGINEGHKAIVVGCGNLARALIKNFDFKKCGFELIAVFDADPALIGTELDGYIVRDVADIEEYVRTMKPDAAVLTVPTHVAHDSAETLVQAGIRGIWNFTNCDLSISDPSVRIENVVLLDSLLTLSYRLSEDN